MKAICVYYFHGIMSFRDDASIFSAWEAIKLIIHHFSPFYFMQARRWIQFAVFLYKLMLENAVSFSAELQFASIQFPSIKPLREN